MRRPSKPPVRTKERYILDSIVSIFKGGQWVEDSLESVLSPQESDSTQDRGGWVSGPENGSCGRTEDFTGSPYITVIGGLKYDGDALRDYLDGVPLDVEVITGWARGVESNFEFLKRSRTYINPDPDRYGKNARKVNVEQVLCFAPDSPLLLVGSGERVKQAKAWLERTKSRREVIELP